MKLTQRQYLQHCSEDNGYCASCDAITRHGETEPDAEEYLCDDCGARTVSGIEQAMVAGLIEILEADEEDEDEDEDSDEEEPDDE